MLQILSDRGSAYSELAELALADTPLTHEQALSVVTAPDEDLLDLLSAAYKVRHARFGKQVMLHFLMNAKSGLCPEDCGYCSQSKVATSDIPKYNLLSRDKLMAGAAAAAERKARTYCMVISARGPNEREIKAMEEIVPEIKATYPLRICVSMGLLNDEHAQRLKACGVDRVNHNLNTSPEHYEKICSTHTYEDRLDTIRAVKNAGMEICCGGIVGMGEQPHDVVRMAQELRQMEAESIPVNFLLPLEGTPLANEGKLNARYCLKVLAMARLTNPRSEIRVAAGREVHLRTLQPLALFAANSLFVGDYLTSEGQPPQEDYEMLEDLGFEIAPQG
jgi:biotin synthase